MLEQILYQVVGMAIVLGSLGVLALGCGLAGRCFPVEAPASPKKNLASPGAPFARTSEVLPPQSLPHAEMTEGEQVAIVAAVYAVCGRESQITEIQLASTQPQLSWSLEGRRQIFQSHRLR